MKKIMFCTFFCLCALAGFAQNSKPLDLKEIVSGEFIPQNISGVIPIPGDGEHYSQMNADKTQIIKYSFKTGKPVEVLFDAATARECPFKKFDSYSLLRTAAIAYCNRNSACIPPLLYSSTLYI